MRYIDKIYGEHHLPEVAVEIINTAVFQRLKRIHQGGALFLINKKINQTRYEHSIGAMLLIKKLGGTVAEQIAGLIHDISHTAFSHLIDYVFDHEEEDYHEKRFADVLQDPELDQVLRKFGFEPANFLTLEQYKILEYPLPYLCADRIDYTLRDLYQIAAITLDEINWFLNGLTVFENRIVLKSKDYGLWILSKYNYLVTAYFLGKQSRLANNIMKQIIKECLEHEIIIEEDFHQDDFYLIEKINRKMNLLERIALMKKEAKNSEIFKTKNRQINPEILVQSQVMQLSEMA